MKDPQELILPETIIGTRETGMVTAVAARQREKAAVKSEEGAREDESRA